MKKTLTIFSANLLFGLTMALVITLGALIQSVTLSWGLILTEAALIALPTVLFLRMQGIPLVGGLRFKRIPLLTGGLCVLLGIALYFIGVIIEAVLAQVSGMQSVPIQSSLLPKTGADMTVYFLALAVCAPFCEEILFRGVIQGAYERRKSARFAITITAVMFAFYHFRLSGLPALLPVAFVLGFVVWRTGSILAGMLIHFGNNGASALQSITYFATGKGLPFLSLWTTLGGLAATIILLIVISRMHPRPVTGDNAPEETGPAKGWLATYWPLFIAGVLYISIAGITMASALMPKVKPATDIKYGLPSLRSPVKSHYVIENRGGELVGEMDCTLSPQTVVLKLECRRTIRAFEYTLGNSFFKDSDHIDTIRAEWDGKTMELLSYRFDREAADGTGFHSASKAGKLTSTDANGTQEVQLPEGTLVEFEWAWRAALLKANAGDSYTVPFGIMMTWDNEENKSTPVVRQEILKVGENETLSLLQGELTVRTLRVAGNTAWYDREDALAGLGRPVKFDDGMFIYVMSK